MGGGRNLYAESLRPKRSLLPWRHLQCGGGTGELLGERAGGRAICAGCGMQQRRIDYHASCYADYNKVGGISVQDIFDFLADWFAGSAFANTGGNGTPGPLSVQNIFDFLADWFAGGC